MRRIVTGLLLVFVLLFGIRWVSDLLSSDETKIRRMLEHMVEGFDDGQARQAISGLAEDWRHASGSESREDLRLFVLGESLRNRDRESKAFRWDAELLEDTLRIQVEEGAETATLEVELRLHELSGVVDGEKRWELRWHFRLDAQLIDGPGGWQIARSSHEDLEGRRIRR